MHRAAEHLQIVARAGYAARGIIYLIVGALAAVAAWGGGGKTTDSRGALTEILIAPFGKILLTVVAAGLVCYAAWRAAQAVLNADDHGRDLKGFTIRAGLGVSAVTHFGLALFALSLVFGWGGSGGEGGSEKEWTAWLLNQPFGPWLVGAVGITIVGVGIAHFIKAWTAKFERHFDMNANERKIITPVSRFGLFARGAVFLIAGGFFLVAAIQHDPSEARGLGGALQALQQQSFGSVLLGIVALGLVAFGVYSVIESVYRRISMTG